MADIDVERRPRSPLPWIIGLLLLAVLGFLLWRYVIADRVVSADVPVVGDTVAP